MPPKTGGGGACGRKRNQSLDNQPRQATVNSSPVHVVKQPLAGHLNQSKFSIASLILEGVKVNKLQLNDLLKQHLNDVKVYDIQLGRTGVFTLYTSDVSSFNRLLNDFTPILTANGQPAAKIFVPRSIQRIKDTEKVAFVKRVDLEIPEDRMTDALKEVGLDVINVTRLNSKDGNTPTRTIKISFNDAQNRNTFVHTGLQVDSMHFNAEAASNNTKPVQCYICLQYNHIAKYCKTKQQVCARCGDNHRIEQCTATNDTMKCSNCKGNHLATSNDCTKYQEQEKRMSNLVKQYSSSSKPTAPAPFIQDAKEYPTLPGMYQRQHDHLQKDMFDELINVLTSKMEKIIEETTKRLFKTLQQKIKKIEKTIASVETLINNDEDTSDSTSDSSDEEIQALNDKNNKQPPQHTATTTKTTKQNNKPSTTASEITSKSPAITNTTSTQSSTASKDTVKKPTTTTTKSKPKPAAKAAKRDRSPDSSLDSTTMDNKDLKTNNNDA